MPLIIKNGVKYGSDEDLNKIKTAVWNSTRFDTIVNWYNAGYIVRLFYNQRCFYLSNVLSSASTSYEVIFTYAGTGSTVAYQYQPQIEIVTVVPTTTYEYKVIEIAEDFTPNNPLIIDSGVLRLSFDSTLKRNDANALSVNYDPNRMTLGSDGLYAGGTYGQIYGNLEDQTDLKDALDAKADVSSFVLDGTTLRITM